MRALPLTAFALASTLLVGCASNEPAPDLQEQELYRQAQVSLDTSRFNSAVQQLEALDTRFPFGSYAEQSQLELIYA
ncbi:MAG: tetratricopeptide repeat protein, partial [Cobetia marina]